MGYIALARDYLVWHYSRGILDLIHIWGNYLWFVNHLFAIPDILRTFFVPWKRLQEKKANILLDPGLFFSNIFVNLIMRMVGIVVRVILLLIALSIALLIAVFGAGFLVFWLLLPVVIAHLLVASITFILS